MIGEKISGCNLYNSAKNEERLIGITGEITLPTYELKTETMSGAGIAGEYDSATPGNFGAVDFEIPFRIMSGQAYEIAAGKIANLTLRYSYQSYDETAGEIVHKSIRINVRGQVKSVNFGKVGSAVVGEASLTIAVRYYKVADEKNKTLFEVDPVNYVHIVNGIDMLAEIRNGI